MINAIGSIRLRGSPQSVLLLYALTKVPAFSYQNLEDKQIKIEFEQMITDLINGFRGRKIEKEGKQKKIDLFIIQDVILVVKQFIGARPRMYFVDGLNAKILQHENESITDKIMRSRMWYGGDKIDDNGDIILLTHCDDEEYLAHSFKRWVHASHFKHIFDLLKEEGMNSDDDNDDNDSKLNEIFRKLPQDDSYDDNRDHDGVKTTEIDQLDDENYGGDDSDDEIYQNIEEMMVTKGKDDEDENDENALPKTAI